MRTFAILGCLLFLTFSHVRAQSTGELTEIDQLKVDANNARYSSTELASSLLIKGLQLAKQQERELDIGFFYRKLVSEKGNARQLDSAQFYFEEGRNFYQKTLEQKGVKNMEDELLLAHLHSEMGEAYSVNFLFEKSRKEYLQSMKYYDEFDDYIGVGIAKINMGNIILKQGDFPKAIETFLEGKAIFDTTEYHYITAEVCNGISSAHEKMLNLDRAIEYAKLYLDYMLKSDYEYPGIINAQIYLAKLHAIDNNQKRMNDYLAKAQAGIDSLTLNYMKPHIASVKAISLLESKNYHAAKELLLSVESFLEESRVDPMQAFEYKQQLAKSLMMTGESKRAESILEEMIFTVDSLHLYEEGVEIAQTLAELYEKNERFDRAYAMLKKHQFYVDQTIGLKQQTAFKEIEEKYQNTVQKNLLLEQQKKIDKDAWRLKRNKLWIVILGLLLVLSLVIYFFVNRNLRAKKQKELHEQELKSSNEKLRISRDLHDNIGSELTLIKSKIDQRIYLLEDEKEIEQLTEISNYSKFAMDELRKTIWATKSDEILLSELEGKMEAFVQRFDIRSSIKSEYEDTSISSLTGLNLYRCTQEAIQNAVKHSEATELVITIKDSGKSHYQIVVSDNGKGFNFEQQLSGNGIENMKERMREIGGEFDVQSSGEGTRIVLVFYSL